MNPARPRDTEELGVCGCPVDDTYTVAIKFDEKGGTEDGPPNQRTLQTRRIV